jgi:hypothetical protein
LLDGHCQHERGVCQLLKVVIAKGPAQADNQHKASQQNNPAHQSMVWFGEIQNFENALPKKIAIIVIAGRKINVIWIFDSYTVGNECQSILG